MFTLLWLLLLAVDDLALRRSPLLGRVLLWLPNLLLLLDAPLREEDARLVERELLLRGDEERLGVARRGADREVAERVGAERWGAERVGAERVGAERVGAERVGAERLERPAEERPAEERPAEEPRRLCPRMSSALKQKARRRRGRSCSLVIMAIFRVGTVHTRKSGAWVLIDVTPYKSMPPSRLAPSIAVLIWRQCSAGKTGRAPQLAPPVSAPSQSRRSAARAWASRPSSRARAAASAARDPVASPVVSCIQVRIRRKECTLRPPLNRAVFPVGST